MGITITDRARLKIALENAIELAEAYKQAAEESFKVERRGWERVTFGRARRQERHSIRIAHLAAAIDAMTDVVVDL